MSEIVNIVKEWPCVHLLSGYWRNIIELSIMINNMEIVVNTTEENTQDDIKTTLGLKNMYQNESYKAWLMLSRPIYKAEIDLGLDISFRDFKHKEKAPKLTYLLDAYFILQAEVAFHKNLYILAKKEINPTWIMGMIIGNNYYDCMSGGISRETALLYKQIILDPRINKDHNIYPRYLAGRECEGEQITEKSYYDFNDFLEDFEDIKAKSFAELLLEHSKERLHIGYLPSIL